MNEQIDVWEGNPLLIWLTLAIVWIIDRVLKVFVQGSMVLGESQVVIPGFFHLTYILNPGAAFGLLPGQSWIFILTAVLAVLGIFYAQFKIPRQDWLLRLTLGLIGGGALGNLYDRLFIGKVVDYLDFKVWPYVFNFADACIVVGAILLVLICCWKSGKPEK